MKWNLINVRFFGCIPREINCLNCMKSAKSGRNIFASFGWSHLWRDRVSLEAADTTSYLTLVGGTRRCPGFKFYFPFPFPVPVPVSRFPFKNPNF